MQLRIRRRRSGASVDHADEPLLLGTDPLERTGDVLTSPRISWNIPLLKVSQKDDFPLTLQVAESVEEQLEELNRLDGILPSSQKNKKKDRQPSKLSITTVETASDTSSSSASSSSEARCTTIRWADECDHPLVTTHHLRPETYRRLVLLLVHPVAHRFEFIHLEYDTTLCLPISHVLAQIPHLCASEWFQSLQYNKLFRRQEKKNSDSGSPPGTPSEPSDDYTELVQVFSCQDYDLGWNETLVASAESFDPKHTQERATQLLQCAPLQKLAKKAKMSGRALQMIEPLASSPTSSPRRKKRDRFPTENSTTIISSPDSSVDNDNDAAWVVNWGHVPEFQGLQSSLDLQQETDEFDDQPQAPHQWERFSATEESCNTFTSWESMNDSYNFEA